MLILSLRGGLGNQMFQLAIGEMIREDYHLDVRYSRFFCRREPNPQSTDSALKNLNIEKIPYINNIMDNIISVSYKALYAWVKSDHIYVSSEVYKYVPLSELKSYKYVDSFFQNYKYFNIRRENLIDKLRVKSTYTPDVDNISMLNHILKSESVCVHIRRGDYVSGKWANTLLLCNEEYYIQAMIEINKRVKNPVFFLFSNSSEDICWIKENYKLPCQVVYVDLENPDYKELYLMYHCKHFILSNSSFSWWAQYLSYNADKIVIAPSKWTNSGENYEGIYGEKWIRI
jgi:hypothetical protein